MKDSLRAGLEGTFRYRVPASKTVPRICEEARDGLDVISRGRHERHVIDAERFGRKLADKRSRARQGA
jgi:hypothetical protein